jgi:Type IV secretion-system coupling protein DNA-binding domain
MNNPHEFQSQSDIAVFAKTSFRNGQIPFGIKQADRAAHIYIIGKTGTGRSTLLETLMTEDLRKGRGFALLDPHGDLVKKIYNRAMALRQKDLLFFDAPNPNQPFGFNPLENVSLDKRSLAASGILQVFKHLWSDSWGPRLEHILRNSLLALLDYPKATFADILTLLSDKRFRLTAAKYLTNSQVKDFWLKEYEGYPARFRAEAIAPIQNKVGAFLSNPILRKILTRPQIPLRLRQIMDEGKILLVNLSKGSLELGMFGLAKSSQKRTDYF